MSSKSVTSPGLVDLRL